MPRGALNTDRMRTRFDESGWSARTWWLGALGVVLALLVLAAGYDLNGREPPCSETDFVRSHPEAATFRSGEDTWGQTCTAIGRDGRVIAVQHYPTRTDWLIAAVALIAPLSLRSAWRRFRHRRD